MTAQIVLTLISVLCACLAIALHYQNKRIPRMPHWLHYDREADVLRIHGINYAADLFGQAGFLGPPGTILRVESGPRHVVTVSKIQIEKITADDTVIVYYPEANLTFVKSDLMRHWEDVFKGCKKIIAVPTKCSIEVV